MVFCLPLGIVSLFPGPPRLALVSRGRSRGRQQITRDSSEVIRKKDHGAIPPGKGGYISHQTGKGSFIDFPAIPSMHGIFTYI